MKMFRNQIQPFSLSNALTSILEKDKPFTTLQIGLLAGLLAIIMLGPIWIGRYAPLYDYPNHLLEAQIVAHYTDPQLKYSDNYQLSSDWYWHSNALSTLLLVGLNRIMPITVAGHLVLSLYVLLFTGSLAVLLYRAGTAWPLLLAAPVLIYNVTFTSGQVNLGYGVALAGYALILYEQWRKQEQWSALLLLAGVLLLVYLAHLMVWGLIVVVIAAMAGADTFQWRRRGELWLALNSVWPLLILTWPSLALLVLLIGPVILGGVALLRWLRLDLCWTIGCAIVLSVVILVLLNSQEKTLQATWPQFGYFINDKITSPLRLFTLAHQFMPPNPGLVSYNLLLLGLVLIISVLLVRSNITYLLNHKPWLLAVGLLTVIYILIPSYTPYTWVTEPRVLIIIVLVTLSMVRLPVQGSVSRRVITVSLGLLCLVSLVGTIRYAQVYDQQATAWQTQMAHLQPARRILMLRERNSPYIARPSLLGLFNRFYTGEYFSTTYNIDYGGLASRTFVNGPVYIEETVPIPAYDSLSFKHGSYVSDNCPKLKSNYEAVLFWGRPQPDDPMVRQLNECFTAGPQWADMGIWYREPPQ